MVTILCSAPAFVEDLDDQGIEPVFEIDVTRNVVLPAGVSRVVVDRVGSKRDWGGDQLFRITFDDRSVAREFFGDAVGGADDLENLYQSCIVDSD